MTRTPNYARQIEAAMEPILDRLVGSPTIPETKRYVIKLRAVASALRDEAAAIDQLADETAAGLEDCQLSVDSGRSPGWDTAGSRAAPPNLDIPPIADIAFFERKLDPVVPSGNPTRKSQATR